MDINNLKNIVGEAKQGEVAVIKFFGRVTEETTSQFNSEFEFLENCVRPSLIRILINSEGGSVLHGMTTYSTISNSKIPTECIIEGIAASMGSVIWAAGDRSLMRDYSILMIHNPFMPGAGEEQSDMVKAFTGQIETIYRKRFGLTKEHVKAIMNGEADKDGTFFDAKAAVKAGIISADCVLKTSKQVCDKVRNGINGIENNAAMIQDMMCKINSEIDENKLSENESSNLKQKDNNQFLNKKAENIMNEGKTIGFEIGAVAASLGMTGTFEVKDVMARISDLLAVEARLTTTQKDLEDAKTVIAGKEATIQNMQKDLDSVNTKLSVYEQKEADEKKARIETMVQNAINEGKIENGAKEQWVQMATANFDLAEKTLASIPAREIITKEIADDPANIDAAKEAAKTAEEKMAEKVKAVVGADFEFKTLS